MYINLCPIAPHLYLMEDKDSSQIDHQNRLLDYALQNPYALSRPVNNFIGFNFRQNSCSTVSFFLAGNQ
jgi:hypothetical protein